MTPTVEQICDTITRVQLMPSAELSRLRTRWFRPDRADAANLDRFGQWLTVNGYLSAFAFRMLRAGAGDLLRMNQYQLVDHLTSGPFAGSYLAADPVQRRVVLDVLAADWAASPEGVRAFQLAAERAMTVRQPNVCLTLDFGEAHGRHYLIREYDEGDTLADLLARRGKLQPIAAARLFAVALLGLQALHDKQVATGPLSLECLLLTAAGKAAGSKARTVKVLHAGVPSSLFDPSALDNAGAAPAHHHAAGIGELPSQPQDDLLRLGIAFYRSLTGHAPFASVPPAGAVPRAVPISQLAPDVPAMLAQLVESMIDPDPSQRPRGAAQVAKSLRVFLASEEDTQQGQPEDALAPVRPAPVPAVEEMAPAEDEAATTGPRAGEGQLNRQLKATWQELRPGQRDWTFLSIGAGAIIALVLFVKLLTGIQFVNVVCLLTGGALSFFVERLLRLREEQPE
jgi:hypothetical protein